VIKRILLSAAALAALPLYGVELYCSPERPVVFSGDSVGLRAWTTDPGAISEYSWSVKAGHVRSEKDSAHWDLTGVDPGRYEATVTARTQVGIETCSLDIFYQNQPIYRGTNAIEAGRSLLQKGAKEPGSYGMYSYLLFGEPENDGNSERYRKALEAYMSLVIPLEQMEAYFDRNQLNVFQIPVTVKPRPREKLTLEQLLAGYDFARARLLLGHAQSGLGDGPYLVSSLSPLESQPGGVLVLIQDLSRIPPSIIDLWVREFLNQAAQGCSWKTDDFRSFLLRVRTVIEIVATGYPQVKSGLEQYIKLVESPK
jgi:hypothetical protein